MSVKAGIIIQHNLFVMKATGTVDDLIVGDFQSSIKAIPGYSPNLNTLFDLSLIDINLVSPESLIRFSSTTPFESTSKRAYVVGDEKASILATIFGTTTSGDENYFITYKLEDACEWLGIGLDELQASSIFNNDEK